MRNRIYMIAALLFGAAACTSENLYEKGADEQPDSYGVYFPTQTSSTVLELDPLEKRNVTYKVSREKYLDAITVPVNVNASEEGIFAVEPIVFKAGEKTAEFTVDFTAAEIGKTYTCTLSIDDPHYVRIYGPNSTSLTFSVVRAAWKALTAPDGSSAKGKWRDDIIGNVFTLNTSSFNRNPELDVTVYEREDQKGYYRMKVYGGSGFLNALAGNSGTVNVAENQDVWTFVDARDPQKVYLPLQSTGLSFSSDYGMCSFGSYVPENFSLDATAAQYGTLKDGVITFPAGSIMFTMASITGYYTVNTNGATRLVLPGYTIPDYSVNLTKSEPLNGKVNITAKLAKDVASVKYAIFDGVLDDGAVSMKAQELEADPTQYEGEITESATMSIADGKTGKYTFVGCIYDKEGKMRDYAYIVFAYVAKGEARPVNLTVGLEATNEYAGQGVSTDNAGRFYAYGEDIESFTYGLYKKSSIAGQSHTEVLDESGTSFSAEQLEAINSGYFSRMMTGLNGDTEYRLLLRASNGYTTRTWYIDYKTTGTFNPGLETDWRYRDFLEQQPSAADLISGDWNYYALNLAEDNPQRRYMGKVSFTRNSTFSTDDLVVMNVKGLNLVDFDNGGELLAMDIKNSSTFNGYNGSFALYADQNNTIGTKNGESVFSGFVPQEDPTNIFLGYGFFFGAVADGYLYAVPAPPAVQDGYTFRYLYVGSTSAMYGLISDMLLVDASKDKGGLPGSADAKISQIRKAALYGFDAPLNYVELPSSGAVAAEPRQKYVNLAVDLLPASAPAAGRNDGFTVVATPVEDEGGEVSFTLVDGPVRNL